MPTPDNTNDASADNEAPNANVASNAGCATNAKSPNSIESTDMPIDGLTVCYTTFNSMRTFEPSLNAALALAKHIVVVDSGSTDGTKELCVAHGITPIHRDWTTPVEQKTFAMSLCTQSPWILLLDSDETILEDLAHNIRAAIETATPQTNGFEVNRVTWLDGRPLMHTFQPEWRLRLVRQDTSTILGDEAGGHDRFELTQGHTARIQGTLRHNSWANARHMLMRSVELGTRTGGYARRGGGIADICFNPAWSFLKQLVLKRGYRDGWRGWVAAAGVASQTLSKQAAIMERRGLEQEAARRSDDDERGDEN
jgi:hypothetical protein